MPLTCFQSAKVIRTSKEAFSQIPQIEDKGGDMLLLPVESEELMVVIQTFLRALSARGDEAADETIKSLVEAFGPLQMKGIDSSMLAENAELRRKYFETVETLTSQEVHALSGRKSQNTAEAASRWTRDGKIFAVKHGREVRIPAFQFDGNQPRPEIAAILAALPEYQHTGWPAAFWFASGHGYLGCAPQEALEDQGRVDEIIEAAKRTGRVVG